MLEKKFIDAIEIVYEKLKKERIEWVLVASTNLALQGMDVRPRDLDILVKLVNLEKIRALFLEYKPSQITKMGSATGEAWEVKANVCGVEVHFFGENSSGVYASKIIGHEFTYLKIKRIKVPCFSLSTESQAYEATNRKEKADKIKEFVRNNGK